jgi:Ca2+/H+ antiporter, TMEM165/GDT1 family
MRFAVMWHEGYATGAPQAKLSGYFQNGRKQMDWRAVLMTFGVIFLAEMGDKTQLAAMTLAAQTRRPWAVLIGASIALTCVSAIGVAVGGVLGEYLPLVWIKRGAAIVFIIIGVLILIGKL